MQCIPRPILGNANCYRQSRGNRSRGIRWLVSLLLQIKENCFSLKLIKLFFLEILSDKIVTFKYLPVFLTIKEAVSVVFGLLYRLSGSAFTV